MPLDGIDATSAAYEVGDESVCPFNREYSRFFCRLCATSKRCEMAKLR